LLFSLDTEMEKFKSLVKKSYGRVIRVREYFKNYFEQAKKHIPNTNLVKPEDRDEFLASQKLEIYHYHFSDSTVIEVPLMNKDENCTPINGIYLSFVAICGTILSALADKIPIRAGLDVGLGALIEYNEIYGPALERAVYLEGRLAEYPRLLVGEELRNYLMWVENQPYKTNFGLITKSLVQRCKNMIIQDTDGRFMLDFLGEEIKNFENNPIDKEIVKSAMDFVISQCKKYIAEGNEKLSSRYYRLLYYFQARKNLWRIK